MRNKVGRVAKLLEAKSARDCLRQNEKSQSVVHFFLKRRSKKSGEIQRRGFGHYRLKFDQLVCCFFSKLLNQQNLFTARPVVIFLIWGRRGPAFRQAVTAEVLL